MAQVEAVQEVTASQVLGPEAPGTPASAEAPKQDERVSPKLQALFQREKIAIQAERAAKSRAQEIESRAKALEEREARIKEFESIKTTNPRRALELLGMTYADLTNVELNDGQMTPDIQVKRLEDKFNKLVTDQTAAVQREAEEAKKLAAQREAATLDAFKKEIETHLTGNPERYELIAFEGAKELVYDVVDEHFERTRKAKAVEMAKESGDESEWEKFYPDSVGEVLTIAQAADKVEQHLEQKYEKAPNLSKVQALFEKSKAKQIKEQHPPAAKPTSPQQVQTPKTLTNQISATQTPKSAKILTDDERIAKAIAYARGLRP